MALAVSPHPPQWGRGLDLNSSNSGCARLGSGVAPPLGLSGWLMSLPLLILRVLARHCGCSAAGAPLAATNAPCYTCDFPSPPDRNRSLPTPMAFTPAVTPATPSAAPRPCAEGSESDGVAAAPACAPTMSCRGPHKRTTPVTTRRRGWRTRAMQRGEDRKQPGRVCSPRSRGVSWRRRLRPAWWGRRRASLRGG